MQKYKVRILLSFFAFLLAFNIFTFPKRASANPLVILGGIAITSEIAYALGTALVTFGGYGLISSPRGQAILDSVANGLVNLGTSGIQLAEDGTAFISNKAWSLVDSLLNKASSPYVQGSINEFLTFKDDVVFNGKSYGPGFAFNDSSHVMSSQAAYYTFGVAGNVLFPPYLDPPSGSPISSYVVRPITSTYSFKLSNGGQSNPSYWVSGFRSPSFDYIYVPGTAYFVPNSGSVSADWRPAYPTFTGQDLFPNSFPVDAENSGSVLRPNVVDGTGTYQDWLNPSLTYDVDSISSVIDAGEGSISNDGVLEHNLPIDIPVDTPFDFGLSFDTLWEWLQSILDAILSIPQSIADFIEYLFVPTISLSDALTYDVNFITQFGSLFDFSFLSDIAITPPSFVLDFDMNGVEGSSVPVYVDYDMETNQFVSDNIDLIRNITTLPLLFSVLFGIIWHFTPKREVD